MYIYIYIYTICYIILHYITVTDDTNKCGGTPRTIRTRSGHDPAGHTSGHESAVYYIYIYIYI